MGQPPPRYSGFDCSMPLFGSKCEYALSLRSRDAATTTTSIAQPSSPLNFVPWVIYCCPTLHESRPAYASRGLARPRAPHGLVHPARGMTRRIPLEVPGCQDAPHTSHSQSPPALSRRGMSLVHTLDCAPDRIPASTRSRNAIGHTCCRCACRTLGVSCRTRLHDASPTWRFSSKRTAF
jgi:hypothetical protein